MNLRRFSLLCAVLAACSDDSSPADDTDGTGGSATTPGSASGSASESATTPGTATEGDSTADTGATDPDTGTDDTGPVIPTDHPRIYLNPDNVARLTAALDDGQPAAVRMREMVDGQLGGADYYEFQAADAALIGALTGDASYCAYAIAQTDAWVTGEEARVANGENAEVAGDSYLYVGDHIGDLSLVLDWCYDDVTADQRMRWIAYADQAVWNVWHPEEATWGGTVFPWSGWSIDNPSNNYYYSFLRATLLLGLASLGDGESAQTWIDTFRTTKIEEQLVPRFTADLVGGGSREGTGYGVAMWHLFQLYDLWEASTGERIWDLSPHTRDSLVNFMHITVPTLDRIAPIGDHARDSTAALFDYHRAYLLVLQRLVGPDDPLAPVVQQYLADCSVPEMTQAFMRSVDFMYTDPSIPTAPLSTLHDTWYAPGTGSVFFRTAWQQDATWGGFIAGPYTESHAHHDQGSLLVYRGEWLGYDANVDSHSGIVQGEGVHNLVRIDDGGAPVPMLSEQQPAELVALHDTPEVLYLAGDITPIYQGAAAVARSEREVVLLEDEGTFVVFDRVDTTGGARAIWQLNAPRAPSAQGDGWRVDGDVDGLDILPVWPANVDASVLDWAATDGDMLGGYRLDLAADPGEARFLVVLAPPGAVDVTAVGAGDELGVDLDFASGATASVRFTRDDFGGSLVYAAPGGASLHDGALGPGIDALPLFAE